jgi:hypothetical protein
MYSYFEKHRLSFSSPKGKTIFGEHFKSGKQAAIQTAAKMLLSDQLNSDGTINASKAFELTTADLWSYIYYVYVFNKETIPEFESMRGDDGLASAERFYDVVKSILDNTGLRPQYDIKKIDKDDLIKFVDKIVKREGDKLLNPVVVHYNGMVGTLLEKAKLVVKTGNVGNNVKIVTNPDNVAKSDIIIKLDVSKGGGAGSKKKAIAVVKKGT